jgi:hypothetical protein
MLFAGEGEKKKQIVETNPTPVPLPRQQPSRRTVEIDGEKEERRTVGTNPPANKRLGRK